MSTSFEQVLKTVRHIHGVLDFLIICGASLLAAWAMDWNFKAELAQLESRTQTIRAVQTKQKSTQAPAEKTENLYARHGLEHDLWSSLENWLNKENRKDGHCLIKNTTDEKQNSFELQCMGFSGSKTEPNSKVRFENLAVMSKNTVRLDNKPTPEKAIKREGWVDTSTGRKHFNTTTKRWAP